MKSEVAIRIARMNDCPAVCQLLGELDDFHVQMRPDVFQPIDGAARPQAYLARLIESHDAEIFLAEVGTNAVGLATIQLTDGPDAPMFRRFQRAIIDDLVVTKRFQRMGIGKRLPDLAIEWARSRDVSSINTSVWTDNEFGASFYEANGFTPLCQRMELKL